MLTCFQHSELVLLLQLHLCPLLLKALSDRPLFPLTLRCTRVVFLLLKQFARELETEAEIFLMLLIKIVGEDHTEQSEQTPRPQWMRVLAMEIMRGCVPSLLRPYSSAYAYGTGSAATRS
jgi:hypothetical protein